MKAIDFIKKNKYVAILLLIIAVSAICQLYKIDRDFNGLHEYEPAQKSLLARNLVELGPFKTRLGPVNNINPLTGNSNYYLYHPFFDIYVYAMFFKVLGSKIITGRLISMFLFYLGVICLYYLVSTLWSKNLALWTSFFYVFFPISQYYGKFVNVTNVILPFIFLFMLFYYLWQRDKKNIHFYLVIITFLLGCVTDWYMYFLAPVAIIHYRYVLKKKNAEIFAIMLVALLTFSFYLLFNQFLTGSITGLQSQWPANIRGPLSTENLGAFEHILKTRMDFGLLLKSSFYITILEHLNLCFTFPVIALILYFLFNYKKFRYHSSPTIYILFMAVTYFGYGLLNPKTLSDHIFLCALLSATVATICALVISNWSRKLQILFAAIFIAFSILATYRLYVTNNTNQNDLMLGKIIPLLSEENDGIALSSPFFSPFIEYYGHRSFLYDVCDFQKLDHLISSHKIKYFVTDLGSFQANLIEKYPVTFIPNNFAVFDLGTNLPQKSKAQKVISFNNNVNLVSYSFERLPENCLLLKYQWEKSGGAIPKFEVFVHFEDEAGNYLFGQDHFILNNLIDLTKPGYKFVEEKYVVKIPDNALHKKLKVLAGLYSPETWQRFGVKNVQTTDSRVRLGEF